MPTGYTAGIIDGNIKTFPEFAKVCMRNFGATIHLRDESLTSEYKPREVSTYHPEQIEKAKAAINEATSLTDEQIVANKKSELEEKRIYYKKAIERTIESRAVLNAMRADVAQWVPPSNDHNGLKEFMLQQLDETIKRDGDTKYYDEELVKIDTQLNNTDAPSIRQEIIAKATKDLSYHTAELTKETNNCRMANEWVKMLLDSLEAQPQHI